MGKGTIISGGTGGQYAVTSVYSRDAVTDEIARLTAAISDLTTQILESDPGTNKNFLKAQKFGCEKRKKYLEDNMPEDKTITAWCADLTENLTGNVGLIEIPGESVEFNIQPGFESNAVYNQSRDGQLVPTIIQTPAQAFYNLAMLPGWQKWKPTFRYATITSLDGDTATIDLESATSTQQNLNVNQSTTIANVEIEYMDCNGVAFAEGDSVLVKFESQSWDAPKIIGFKDNPKPCQVDFLEVVVWSVWGERGTILWDIKNECLLEGVTDNNGDPVTFPVFINVNNISGWLSTQSLATQTPALAYDSEYRVMLYYPPLSEDWAACYDSSCDELAASVGCSSLAPNGKTCTCLDDITDSFENVDFIDNTGATSGTVYLGINRYCTQYFSPETNPPTEYKYYTQYIDHPGQEVYHLTSLASAGGTRGLIKARDEDRTDEVNDDGTTRTREYSKTVECSFNSPFSDDPAIEFEISNYYKQVDSVYDSTSYDDIRIDNSLSVSSGMSDKNMFFVTIQQERYARKNRSSVVQYYFNTVDSVASVHIGSSAEGETPVETMNPFELPRQSALTDAVQSLINSVKIESTTSDLDTVYSYSRLYEI